MGNPVMVWLIAGAILCVMELVLPTAFVELTMGLSAIAIALLLLVVPQMAFGLQVAIWLALSVLLTVLTRRFVPKHKSMVVGDSVEAKTLTDILPGQTGRVVYEGNSWAARCSDDGLAIAPGQNVYVVGRQGTTLIVVPKSLLESDS
jgi:membrane protein implicated in regulation of membrane protease activity